MKVLLCVFVFLLVDFSISEDVGGSHEFSASSFDGLDRQSGNFEAPLEDFENTTCEYYLSGSGFFKSPYFPNSYPKNANCSYYLETSKEWTGVSIKFYTFYMEEWADTLSVSGAHKMAFSLRLTSITLIFSYWTIQIYLGHSISEENLIYNLTGYVGSDYFATGQSNRLLVHFQTNNKITERGFNAYFEGSNTGNNLKAPTLILSLIVGLVSFGSRNL